MARKALGRGLGALIPNVDRIMKTTPRPAQPPAAGSSVTDPQVERTDTDDPRPEQPEGVLAAHGQSDEEKDQRQERVAIPPTAPTATAPGGRTRRALASGRASAVIEIALDRIEPNPYQPRLDFAEEELQGLAQSIRECGVLQPVLVRRRGVGYELIAGERRLRATRRADLNTIPAIVRDAPDEDMLGLALIENQQRVDLNPIEAAKAYQRSCEEFGLTTEELADVIGRDRSTVANLLRLLTLPDSVQALVREGRLQMGHARALAGVQDPARCQLLARRAVRSELSVRAVERLARADVQRSPRTRRNDPELEPFEDRLRRRFATQVRIVRRRNRGRVEIEFYNQNDLERILEELKVLR